MDVNGKVHTKRGTWLGFGVGFLSIPLGTLHFGEKASNSELRRTLPSHIHIYFSNGYVVLRRLEESFGKHWNQTATLPPQNRIHISTRAEGAHSHLGFLVGLKRPAKRQRFGNTILKFPCSQGMGTEMKTLLYWRWWASFVETGALAWLCRAGLRRATVSSGFQILTYLSALPVCDSTISVLMISGCRELAVQVGSPCLIMPPSCLWAARASSQSEGSGCSFAMPGEPVAGALLFHPDPGLAST